jgi:uncharacterized repeat protein (TIGR03843 family)
MSEPAGLPDPSEVPADETVVLATGDIDLQGRILPASNATFYGTVTLRGRRLQCVYKPVAGERPLWDFPDGTLARREVAAYVVSEALGWNVVPPTLLRDGPAGPGMVQCWREPDPDQAAVDLVPDGVVPDGFLHVLDAFDGADQPVSLVHEDSAPLRRMAVFDIVVNNADRKGGHVLAMPDGHRYGVDHGVSFHVDEKLRTVLWGWADEPLDATDAAGVAALVEELDRRDSDLAAVLGDLLTAREMHALTTRCRRLLARGRMPLPTARWPAIPWPAF